METRTANTHTQIIDQINYDESKPIREHTGASFKITRTITLLTKNLKNLNYGIRLAGHAVKSVL